MQAPQTIIMFRRASATDLSTLLEFMRCLNEDDDVGQSFDEPRARAATEQLLRDSHMGEIWMIGAKNGDAIGYVILTLGFSIEFGGRDAFIDEFFVASNYRGQGIGKQAIEFAAQRCRDLGVRALHLEVSRDNLRAQYLYRKSGFRDRGYYLMTRYMD